MRIMKGMERGSVKGPSVSSLFRDYDGCGLPGKSPRDSE
jgi:hypothetical protein